MTEQATSPLRRRMIEDMTIRKFAQKTQHDYVQRVKDFASYLKRSPDTAKPEDVRGFQFASDVERRRRSHDQHHNFGTTRARRNASALGRMHKRRGRFAGGD